MDPKKVTPAVTLVVLGGVYLFLQYKHQPVPPALSQAMIAAAGSVFAGTALAGALPKPKEAGNATTTG